MYTLAQTRHIKSKYTADIAGGLVFPAATDETVHAVIL